MQNTFAFAVAVLLAVIPSLAAAGTPATVSAGAVAQAAPSQPTTPPTTKAPPPPPPRHEGTAEFAFVGTTGNADAQTLGLNGEYIFRPESWVIRNKASFVRNESEGLLTVEQFGYTVRGDRAISPRTAAFGEYSYFRDRFAGISHRNQVLGGIAYKLVNLPEHLLVIDGGLGYLNEQRLAGEDVSTATYAAGAGYKWKISPTAEFAEDFRFTGGLDAAENWRILQGASITARINALFSLKLSNTIRYNNMPVPGFKETDTTTSVALVAKF